MLQKKIALSPFFAWGGKAYRKIPKYLLVHDQSTSHRQLQMKKGKETQDA